MGYHVDCLYLPCLHREDLTGDKICKCGEKRYEKQRGDAKDYYIW
jgi:hypothetical protein